MKILVHSPLTGGAFARYPLMLSVIQDFLDQGHEVVCVECDGAVPACVMNLEQSPAVCRYCIARGAKGRSRVRPQPQQRRLSSYLDGGTTAALAASEDDFMDGPSLKAVQYRGVDVGYAALSSYAHVTRDPEPDASRPEIRSVLQRLVNTGKIVFEAYERALGQEEPDLVAVFNGRLAIDRPVLRACLAAGIDCHVYEISLGVDTIIRYENALPHDIACLRRQIDDVWSAAATDIATDREAVGRSFFEIRRPSNTPADDAIRINSPTFTGRQREGRLPEDWNAEHKNIVVYGSSDDEFCAISPEWEQSVYAGQFEALDAMCRGLAGTDAHVFFRMHPRLRGMEQPYVRRIATMGGEHENLTVILPESPVSSYALLDHCDVVCTFRSTMTLEAPYWDKPCIALANSLFSQLGVTYNPKTHDEVMAMLRSELAPKDPLPAICYGYYRLCSGFKNSYYHGDQSRGGRRGYTFKGRPIFVGGWPLVGYRLSRFRQRIRWA